MFDEFALEVSIIKIKIKGYLKNNHTKSKEIIDTFGIKSKKNITYTFDNTKYKLNLFDNKIVLTRENQEFINNFTFIENIKTQSTYYIKEFSTNIEVHIITNKITIDDNKIEIEYTIEETNEKYQYVIEMSERI